MTDAFASLAAIAVEIEKWKAVEAKKRQLSTLKQNQDGTVPENLPERMKDRSKESSEQAGAMLGVSGRSVRDAKKRQERGVNQ